MNIPETPIAVELTHIKQDKIGNPVLTLSAPILPFNSGQVLQANIYNDMIIIAPVKPDTTN